MIKSVANETIKVDQDLKFQSLFWKIERVGWVIFLIILISTFLGLTGKGPLNSIATQSNDIQIKYDFFARLKAPSKITIKLNNTENGNISFWVERDFLSNYQVQQITPEPDSVTSSNGRLYYEFQQENPPLEVIFELQPQAIGSINGSIGQNENEVTINQFIYP